MAMPTNTATGNATAVFGMTVIATNASSTPSTSVATSRAASVIDR